MDEWVDVAVLFVGMMSMLMLLMILAIRLRLLLNQVAFLQLLGYWMQHFQENWYNDGQVNNSQNHFTNLIGHTAKVLQDCKAQTNEC